MKQLFTLVIILLCAGIASAQPTERHERYGCHFVKNKLHKAQEPLTPERLAAIAASNSRSDTFDILHYDIKIDITSYTSKKIKGECTLLFAAKMDNIPLIHLDLEGLQVDSIKSPDGTPLAFTHQGIQLIVTLPAPLPTGATGAFTVWYQGTPIQSPSNFGGVYFESNYIYNLSIGLTDNPHNFGHAWFPCFDNFVERSGFDLAFLTTLPFRAYASGDFIAETPGVDSNTVWRHYRMDIPACTYHVSFAAAHYGVVSEPHTGLFGNQFPIEMMAKLGDTARTRIASMEYLHESLDCFEYWFGPFPYNRVGYALATRGAMENPGNTIYPDFLIQPNSEAQHINILTHELAHQWWGNVVTVGSASDMWVKEGNAEYGAHLFHEYYFGKQRMKEVQQLNNYDMLLNAHYDDGDFYALSPMPQSNTYGTTPYNKGALTMHNLRHYLGDSLYRAGMTYLQTALRYEAMDAYEMRDTLGAFTGVDLKDFFDDWIFQPGWSNFMLDSLVVQALPTGQYQAKVFVRQGIRAANHIHHNTPIEVDFRKADGTFDSYRMNVPGEKGDATFTLPYEPVYCTINRNQSLNLAQYTFEKTMKAAGNASDAKTLLNFNVKNVPANDSAWIWAVHHWTAPEATPNLPATVKISGRHFWTVGGNWPEGFVTNVVFRFDNSQQNAELDADVAPDGVHEDSLLLLYRPGAGHEWVRFPRVTLFTVGSVVDGFGLLRADTVLPGEYAIGSGYMDFPVAASTPKSPSVQWQVMPNPVSDQLRLQWESLPKDAARAVLFNPLGVEVRAAQIQTTQQAVVWEVASLTPGVYTAVVMDAAGKTIVAQQVIKQ